MRNIFFLGLLLFLSESVTAQKIEYRQDSLYIQGVYVDAYTPKEEIDKILNEKGALKSKRVTILKAGTSGKKQKEHTAYYPNHGLHFRWYDADSAKFSVSINLYKYSTKQDEKTYGIPGERFSGDLYIEGNYINDKRSISSLEALTGCTLEILEGVVGSYRTIIGGDLVCQKNLVRLSFDTKTRELTQVHVHQGFKNE